MNKLFKDIKQPLRELNVNDDYTTHLQPEVNHEYATHLNPNSFYFTAYPISGQPNLEYAYKLRTQFVQCNFCRKYDRIGALNCSRCNSSLVGDNVQIPPPKDQSDPAKTDEEEDPNEPYWVKCNRCCDTCMNRLGVFCLYITLSFILFVIPVSEIVELTMHWNNYGGCSVYFQYLILSKLLITLVIYSLFFIYFKCFQRSNNISKICIVTVSMILLLCWCILATIVFFDEDSFDETHCNAHDAHTAGYYDFMYIEIVMVYVIFALIICTVSWFIVSLETSMVIISTTCFIGYFGVGPLALPCLEIVVLVTWWDDYGHCSPQFQYYILAKLVLTVCIFIVGVVLYCNKLHNNKKIKRIFGRVVFVFLSIWVISAWSMFFDPNGFDHHHCNHHAAHTAILYDFMFMEIVVGCALTVLLGSILFWLGAIALLCPTKDVDELDDGEV